MKRVSVKAHVTFLLLILLVVSCKQESVSRISIIETTDIHGVILPYDFIEKRPLNYSLANSATYINTLREKEKNVVLLDNGDNLQGQPEVYYYNYIDTVSPHFVAEVMNWLHYDAGTAGNHDIEAGHRVYDRLVRLYSFPLLAANAVDKNTGKPYFKPYAIIKKGNIHVAVLGLTTPAIPTWLPEELYSGIEFKDMVETAKKWMPDILKEKPDLVVGLFHSGWENSNYRHPEEMEENGSAAVAYNVKGFDIIFTGHDHRIANKKFINSYGDTVLILNGGSHSQDLAEADIILGQKKKGKRQLTISGKIIPVRNYKADTEFLDKFKQQDLIISNYVDKVIGNSTAEISSRDAYFGSSAFVDMIQKVQLSITHADVSFAAPLSFDVSIAKGPVTVGDMFKLYKYENMLYTMKMTGLEIKRYLEYSYSRWLNTMKGPSDYLLKFRMGTDGKPVLTNGRAWLLNQSYNFDSAAGIDYTVDVTKPEGSRITIKSFTNGKPFIMSDTCRVAVNSYRGNGGGDLLTSGAGIAPGYLKKRVISSTDRDLRYFIMKYIEEKGTITPERLNNWQIVPAAWVKKAEAREYPLLFGTGR